MCEIDNANLCKYEREWIREMVRKSTTADIHTLVEQINAASVGRVCEPGFVSVRFDVPDGTALLPAFGHEPVMLDMLARIDGSAFPIDVLLHVRNGRVEELEAYNVAGDCFDCSAPISGSIVRDWTDPDTRGGARPLP